MTISFRCSGVPNWMAACTTRLASCCKATWLTLPFNSTMSSFMRSCVSCGVLVLRRSLFQISLAAVTASAWFRCDCRSCFNARFCWLDDFLSLSNLTFLCFCCLWWELSPLRLVGDDILATMVKWHENMKMKICARFGSFWRAKMSGFRKKGHEPRSKLMKNPPRGINLVDMMF